VLVVSPWVIVTTYVSGRFPTHVRASGYSAAVTIPAFTGFGQRSLISYMFTPLVPLVVATLLIMVVLAYH
jgi:hypothetical protein